MVNLLQASLKDHYLPNSRKFVGSVAASTLRGVQVPTQNCWGFHHTCDASKILICGHRSGYSSASHFYFWIWIYRHQYTYSEIRVIWEACFEEIWETQRLWLLILWLPEAQGRKIGRIGRQVLMSGELSSTRHWLGTTHKVHCLNTQSSISIEVLWIWVCDVDMTSTLLLAEGLSLVCTSISLVVENSH